MKVLQIFGEYQYQQIFSTFYLHVNAVLVIIYFWGRTFCKLFFNEKYRKTLVCGLYCVLYVYFKITIWIVWSPIRISYNFKEIIIVPRQLLSLKLHFWIYPKEFQSHEINNTAISSQNAVQRHPLPIGESNK